jgi:hypothetical protein
VAQPAEKMPSFTVYEPSAASTGACQVAGYDRCWFAKKLWLSNQTWYVGEVALGPQISMSTSAVLAMLLVASAVMPTDPPAGMLVGVADELAAKVGPGTGVGAAVGVAAGVAVGPPVVDGVAVGPEGGIGVGAGVATGAAATLKLAAEFFAPKSDFQPSEYA